MVQRHRSIDRLVSQLPRSQRVVIDSTASERLLVTSGVPQGSHVGPLLDAIHQWPSWYYPPSNEHRLTCRWYQNAPPILKMKDCDILGQDLKSLNTRSYETNMKFRVRVRVRVRVQSVNSHMKENYCNSWLSPQRCKLRTCSGRNRSYHF